MSVDLPVSGDRVGPGGGLRASVAEARHLVAASEKVTVLTGAGVSTDSGLPDFRGPKGLWTKNPAAERASHISVYVSDPEVRRRNWQLRAEGRLWADVAPNRGHEALVHLERRRKLRLLITQNVDGLHQMAGNSAGRVVEIHGTTREAQCLSCSYRDSMEAVLERVRTGEPDPACPRCGGILKSATVSFGQSLDPDDLARAERASAECDLFCAVGTTLTVSPINQAAAIAVHSGARLLIVNAEPTDFDPLADVVVRGSISEVLPQITALDPLDAP